MPSLESRRLIVVDDEPDIRNMIAEYLGKDGCAVTCCANARELDVVLAEGRPDVILLDVNLPGEDGISIARRLRASGNTPILMLTALNDVVDRIIGLEVGADDYLAKPFDLRELKARVRAILRRSEPTNNVAESPQGSAHASTRINFGRVALDLDEHCLVCPEGAKTKLTATEFELLVAFGRNPHRVLSRDRLLDGTPGQSSEVFDRAIDIRITRIRKKVEHDPAKPKIIKTVRGAGYMYVPPAQTL